MCQALFGIDHVAPQHRNHARAVGVQRIITGGKCHGPTGIDKSAERILGGHKVVLRHQSLTRAGQGTAILRKIPRVNQRIPVGAHPPGIVDGQDVIKTRPRPGLRLRHNWPGAKDQN